MIAVPEATPVTTPVGDTVATAGFPLLQVPPGEASDKFIVEPTQTFERPVIGAGDAVTFTVVEVEQPPTV